MHKKQKINAASQILSRGLLVFHKYFKNEAQFWQFKAAESEGEAAHYIETSLTHLSLGTQENLVICYRLQQQLSNLTINRTKTILISHLSDFEGYEKASDLGILTEYEWLKAEFQDNDTSHKGTILKLIEQEIQLISKHVEDILALDPERTIEQQFSDHKIEIPSYTKQVKQLTKLIEQNKVLELGEVVLQYIQPSDQRLLFPFPLPLKEQIQQKLMVWIRFLVMDDETLTQPEKKATLSNMELYMQFLEKQPEFECVACFALILDSVPEEYRFEPDHIVRWFHFGQIYRNIGFLREKDHAVLLQLDQAIEKNIAEIQRTNNSDKDKLLIQKHLHARLAKEYEYYWEWEKAMQHYQQEAKISLRIRQNQLDFEGALNKMIECLQKHFQYEIALNLCFQFLQGNFQMLGVSENITLSTIFEKSLEYTLINLVGQLNPPPQEYRKYLSVLKSETFKIFAEMLEKMKNKDEISNDNIDRLDQFFNSYLAETAAAFGEEMTEEEQVKSTLDLLGMFDYSQQIIATKLDSIAPLIPKQSADLRLRYDLNQAKLKYFQKNTAAVTEFEGLLPLMELYPSFDKKKKINWRVEFLRAISLQITEHPSLIDKVEQLTLEIINLKLADYLDSYREPAAAQLAMQDIEKVYNSLILNVEKASNQKEITQRLLKVLWNCLLVFKRFLNQFSVKATTKILDTNQYQKQVKTLKELLTQIYINGNFDLVGEANYCAQKIKALEHPYFEESNRISQFNIPKNRSVLYHFFTKMDNQRILLIMTFKEGTFYYKTVESFETIEKILQKIESNQELTWRNMGILSLLTHSDSLAQVAKPIAHFFNYFYEKRFDMTRFISALQKLEHEKDKPAITKEELVHLHLDNFLHQFPIEMLPFEHEDEKLIGTRFSLCNVLYRDLGEWHIQPNKGIAIFADIPNVGLFPALPHTKIESAGIDEQFSSKGYPTYSYLNQTATVKNFQDLIKKEKPSILHFALHGVASKELAPETCALILCPASGSATSTALLTYEDIIRLDLGGVDLVVLSACNSSTGQIMKGTPMQGLAFAFLAAGASFVVASRIKTKDTATQLWMNKFYSYLFQTDISNAMRLTRTHFVEKDTVLSKEDIAAWGLWS